MKKNTLPKKYLLPQYWPIWFLIGLLWLTAHLPYRIILWLGKGLGLIMLAFGGNSKRVARINLRHCFPELDEAAREKLLKKSFMSVGISMLETAMGFWSSNKKLAPLTHINGAENFDRALEKGKGVIMLGAHFTTIEIAGRLCNKRLKFSVMFSPSKLGILDFIIKRAMHKHYHDPVEKQNVRQMIKLIKQGKAVWYSADVNAGRKASVFAPFFGVPAATTKLVTRFHEMTDCTIIPTRHYRRDDGTGYDIELLPPLENFPTGDLVEDARIINAYVEASVRIKPEQYLWQYMRFKTRPNPDDPRIYSKRFKK